MTRAFYATATITTLVVLALAIVAREFILRKNDLGFFNVSKMRLLLVAVYVAAVLPGAIVIGGVLPLPQVNVCGADPKLDRSGLLIGLTSDRVYIAERLGPRSENPGKTRGKVDAISSDLVTETFIGRDARFVGCEYESSPSPSVPPLPGHRGDPSTTRAEPLNAVRVILANIAREEAVRATGTSDLARGDFFVCSFQALATPPSLEAVRTPNRQVQVVTTLVYPTRCTDLGPDRIPWSRCRPNPDGRMLRTDSRTWE